MKRFLALLLTLAMVLSLLPTAIAAQPKEEKIDLWEEIIKMEDQVTAVRGANSLEARQAAYVEIEDQIIQLIESSENYVPDSLIRHGDFFFWDETDGTACGYSPRLRAQMRENAVPNADPEDYADISVVSYDDRGGSPNSTVVSAFQPYIGIDGSFTAQYENECNSIAQAIGGTGVTYKTTNATIDNIAQAIQTSAVVIFDSHGDTDYASGYDYTSRANTSYICLQSGDGFTAEDQATVTGPYGSYKHAYYAGGYGSMKYYCADGTAISNHMSGTSPNGLLWMAICLGMATDGMHAPLRAKGVEVAYGYSQSVTFSGDYAWEAKFWGKMKNDDSEVQEAIAFMKQQVGCPDPYTSSYPAYPIVVSSEDVYPGHGNVDAQQTVHSTWTLYSQYNITAVSNNNAWGTVAVSGRQITATPNTGYEVVGYEVLDGTCTVTQNGNVFQVNAETDCTIRINFAARVPATVTFNVPEGVSCDNFNGYVGDTITLPTPTGTPTANAHNYAFRGWTTAPIEDDITEVPTFVKAGTEVTVTDPSITYYALYSYFIADEGFGDGEFNLVTSARTNWSGEYVITYQGEKVLDASGDITGSTISSAVAEMSEIGGVLNGNSLSNVDDAYIYVVEEVSSGVYSIKMKEPDVWLALTSNSNSLNTATSDSADAARWTFAFGDDGVKITSVKYTERSLRYNTQANVFRCYKQGQQPIALYASAPGTKYYTTVPKDGSGCDHVFGDWTTVTEPTCTTAGQEKRVCTLCGFTQTHTLNALGHDYNAVVTEPTCTEAGYTTHTCSRCNDTYTDSETAALGHDFNDWTQTTAPTCTTAGEETRTCARCNTVETRTVEALGHDYTAVVTSATCTEGGYTTYTCSRCNDTYTADETEPLGHDYTAVVTEPTCTEAGFTTYTCSRCNDSYTGDETEALGHDYTAVVTEPTCTEAGFTTYTCSRCNDSYTGDETEALGHDWGEGTVIAEPTHQAPGQQSFTCARCGETKTEEIEKLANPFEDVHDEDFFFNPVMWALDESVTGGIDETHFAPERTVMRADAMVFFWAANGRPEFTATDKTFKDVKKKHWAYSAVMWAVENGITAGTDTAGLYFSPSRTCTRSEILQFLYAAMGSPEYTIDNPYSDVKPKHWYVNGAIWAYEKGLEKGENGKFQAKTPCTRGYVVTYLYRYFTGNELAE